MNEVTIRGATAPDFDRVVQLLEQAHLPLAGVAEHFSNFLVARDPAYPSWSETNHFRDYTQINEAGNPLWVYTMRDPRRFHEAYLEFRRRQP